MDRTPRSRVRWSLAIALAMHAAAIAWGPRVLHALRSAPPPPSARVAPSEIELEVESLPPPVVAETPAPEPLPPSLATPAAPVAARAVGTDVPARPLTPAPSEPSAAPQASAALPSVAPQSSAAAAGWSFSAAPPPPGASGEGSGGAGGTTLARATARGVGEVVAEAERKAADRQKRPKVFTPNDWSLGLVPGGQYATLTRDRVRSSLVPMNGHALLEFSTDRKGLVARVRVLDASSDRRAWDDVADALVEDARGAFPLQIPDNADGLVITLDVTSVLKTLSGSPANQGALGRVVGAIMDPLDTIADSKAPPQRLVTAKIVGVTAF
jgi:hypothetical protein